MSLNKVTKGIVFAGCSFTWGQGLYYYSNMPTLDLTCANTFTPDKITLSHIKYKDTLRFPRLVSNHFNTFEIVKDYNGGCDDDSIEFINTIFDNVKYDEISHIIFQTSELSRNTFSFVHDNVLYKTHIDPKNPIMYKWMLENDVDFLKFMQIFREQMFLKIKQQFIKYEEKGIVCKILCWKDDYVSLIKSDPFFDGKFINFEYNDVTYDCIDYLIKINKGMDISTDVVTLGKVLYDEHPSKLCHQIIANNIIKKLEEEKI